MPPKIKDEGEKKKKPLPIIIEGINVLEATFPALLELTLGLHQKLLNRREERLLLQAERDKLRHFWEITRQDYDLAHVISIKKDNELEKVENESSQLLKQIEQEIKYVHYHHKQNILNQHKSDQVVHSKVDNEMAEEELELLAEKKRLKEKLKNIRSTNENELKEFHKKNFETSSEVKYECENKLIEVKKKFIDRIINGVNQQVLKHQIEMSELEERFNSHISVIKSIHKKQFNDMKSYYNSVTKENVEIIKKLKENIEQIKQKQAQKANEVKTITKENKNLVEPLKNILSEVKDLKRIQTKYRNDMFSINTAKKSIERTQNKINQIKISNSKINLEIKKSTEIGSKPLSTPIPKSGHTTLQHSKSLHEMIEILKEELKSKFKELNNIMNLNQKNKLNIKKFMETKGLTIEQLQYELAVVCKAHDDMIRSYEGKLKQFGIDNSVQRFKPLAPENIRRGPAGLVTKNL
uniref:Dynein regulatory complex subunit 4 n=1 Tax=Clastoptera arizonana TaxID=38151 RepID=A0A1B6DY79_9HEMI